ncbi:MAG TPA: YraN family protein [Thermoanaerobaculia bacterium]|nr:YraN family protein [Thermoanaerobaculia bacterium]
MKAFGSDFEAQPHTRARGRAGEDAACAHLAGEGYRIVERNVSTAAGEIDIVAEEGDTLCFVEVKARADAAHGPAVAFVGPAKQRRLARCCALYLVTRQVRERPIRFDVLGLERADGAWRCELVRGAFEATESFLV